MIDGLIGGKLYGKPAQRVGQSGKAFVTAKVRTPTANGETLFVNVIAFSESVGSCAAGPGRRGQPEHIGRTDAEGMD
jgi:hypothetical protein